MTEIWKDIKGYESSYQVSNLGRVKSLARVVERNKTGKLFIKERILKNTINNNDYFVVDLCKYRQKKHFSVHRLVAMAFVSNPENKPEVNHKDGNKQNNNIDNLEWATSKENTQHSYDIGLQRGRKGISHPLSKLTEKQVIEIKTAFKNCYVGLGTELAKKYNVHKETIYNIKDNKNWKHIKI